MSSAAETLIAMFGPNMAEILAKLDAQAKANAKLAKQAKEAAKAAEKEKKKVRKGSKNVIAKAKKSAEKKASPKKEKGKRRPTAYNMFMKQALKNLREAQPGQEQKVLFKLAVEAWHEEQKENKALRKEVKAKLVAEVPKRNKESLIAIARGKKRLSPKKNKAKSA